MIQPEVPTTVAACCSTIYGSPLAELLVGDSFHPGGREGTRELLAAGDLRPRMRLLDAGCGLGASARLAAREFGVFVDAVDASGSIVERARGRGDNTRIQWREAALPALPYAIIIAKAGGALDAGWLIGAAVLAGTGLAIWLGRRPAGDDVRGSGRPMELDDGPPSS